LATHSQNQANRTKQKNNHSGFKNVILDKRNGHYFVQITKDGHKRRLGTFKLIEDANVFAEQKRQAVFGDFARA